MPKAFISIFYQIYKNTDYKIVIVNLLHGETFEISKRFFRKYTSEQQFAFKFKSWSEESERE